MVMGLKRNEPIDRIGKKGVVSLILILSFAFFSSCQKSKITGEFGWSATDDRGIQEPELGLLVETEFRYGREDLFFYDYETVWWIYQINSGSYKPDEFLAVLYENTGSPDPVEVDLRQVRVEKQAGRGFIRQKYEGLEPGRYILKIAHESRAIDQVEFEIVPPEGPAGDREFQDRSTGDGDEILEFSSSSG